MESTLSPAAQVRRRFRVGLGRPRKPEQLPLHPAVVWQRATEALNKFRGEMLAAGLSPKEAEAALVYVKTDAQNPVPEFLFIESPTKSSDEMRRDVFEVLGRDGVAALGLVFRQFDNQLKKEAYFPYPLAGLENRHMAVLKAAAMLYQQALNQLRQNH
jgi:hypothetical protein